MMWEGVETGTLLSCKNWNFRKCELIACKNIVHYSTVTLNLFLCDFL